MTDKIITIETSCGETFRMPIREMSNYQLINLIEQNDSEPEVAWLRAELQRRRTVGAE
jgi:hypothetical protein